MAHVKLGETIVGLRGTIGGITFSQNRAGVYCKKLSYSTKKRTPKQEFQRLKFIYVKQDWSQCTQQQVEDWDAFALAPPEMDYDPWGVQIFLTGAQWHSRINLRRFEAGQSLERDAPVSVAEAAPATFGLTIYRSGNAVDDSIFTYTEDDFLDRFAYLRITSSISEVVQSKSTGWMNIWCTSIDGATSTVIRDQLVSAFGILETGQKIFGELRAQSTDGIRSAKLSVMTTVLEES